MKANLKWIKNLINNKNLLVGEMERGEAVTPCMDVYKEKIQSDGRILVGGYLQNKDLIGNTW